MDFSTRVVCSIIICLLLWIGAKIPSGLEIGEGILQAQSDRESAIRLARYKAEQAEEKEREAQRRAEAAAEAQAAAAAAAPTPDRNHYIRMPAKEIRARIDKSR